MIGSPKTPKTQIHFSGVRLPCPACESPSTSDLILAPHFHKKVSQDPSVHQNLAMISTMTRSRNLVWACTVIGCSVVLYGILGENVAQMTPLRWTPNGFSGLSRSSSVFTSNVCQVEDIVYGEWLNDKPLSSMEDVTQRYQLAVSFRMAR
jgi:hypothetical protein